MRHHFPCRLTRIVSLSCLLLNACAGSDAQPGPGAGGTGGGTTGGGGSGTAGTGDATGAAGTGTSGTAGTGRARAAPRERARRAPARTGTGATGRGGAAGTGTAGTGGGRGHGRRATTGTAGTTGALVGWAAVSGSGVTTTTGGGSATPQTVTTVAALNSAAGGTGAAVIYVSGVLPNGSVRIGSNKTIVGLCGAEIHGHVDVVGSSNVIVRNIKIVGYGVGDCALDPSYDSSVGCSSGDDAMTVEQGAPHLVRSLRHLRRHRRQPRHHQRRRLRHRVVDQVPLHPAHRQHRQRLDGRRRAPLQQPRRGLATTPRRRRAPEHHLAPRLVGRQRRRAPAARPLRQEPPVQQPLVVVGSQLLRAGRDGRADPPRKKPFSPRKDPSTKSTRQQKNFNNISLRKIFNRGRGPRRRGAGAALNNPPFYTYERRPMARVQSAVQAGAGPH